MKISINRNSPIRAGVACGCSFNSLNVIRFEAARKKAQLFEAVRISLSGAYVKM
jgi:hypothetical protein